MCLHRISSRKPLTSASHILLQVNSLTLCCGCSEARSTLARTLSDFPGPTTRLKSSEKTTAPYISSEDVPKLPRIAGDVHLELCFYHRTASALCRNQQPGRDLAGQGASPQLISHTGILRLAVDIVASEFLRRDSRISSKGV